MTVPWQQQVFDVSIRKKEKWHWVKQQLARYVQASDQCLDVGSGVGTLSQLQEKLGGQWTFTETDAAAAQEARNIVRGQVLTIDLFDNSLHPGSYDLLTLFDVIEHVPQPVPFMQRAQELVRPGGYIILTTPADSDGYYLWRRLAQRIFGIDKAAHGHVVEGFSAHELRELCQRTGLQVLCLEQFSFFFTEMVELLYNGAYVLKNRRRQSTTGYNLALSPASGRDVTRHRSELALLRLVYPLLRGVSLLDRLSLSSRGYEWGLVARRPPR